MTGPKLKLLLVTPSFWQHGGGIASYARDFCNAIRNHYNIIVITHEQFNNSFWQGIPVTNLGFNSTKSCDAKTLLKTIEDFSPDIVVNSGSRLMSIITPFIKDTIKIINISHFIDGQLADIAGLNSRFVDSVVVLSDYAHDYLKRNYGNVISKKLVTVYNFCPKHLIGRIKSKSQNNEKLNIVYPGGASPAKSPDIVFSILLSLIKTNLKFNFYWMGDTTLPKSKFFKTKSIKELFPVDGRVFFTGKISREEAQGFIKATNIFLLPSRKEGCPISLIEAMGSGTIPIVSDAKHASAEIIKNGFNGFVIDKKNPEAFSKQIIEIIKNHSNYSHIYNNSFETATSLLSETLWQSKMFNILNIECHAKRLNFSRVIFLAFKILFVKRVIISRGLILKRNLKIRLFFLSCQEN